MAVVTGANGFIGQNLLRRFAAEGWDTRPVVRQDFQAGALERLFDDATVVVHAAGATRAPTRAGLLASNVALTRTVINAAQRSKVGRLILISSQAAAGPAASKDRPVTEGLQEQPREAYGRSKLAAESILRTTSSIPFVIIRPSAVYGPGDRDFLTMFRLVRLGIAVYPGTRDHWLSIVHVDDLARGIVLAATAARAAGGTYFIANDEPVQWKTLFNTVAHCASRKLTVDLEVPMAVMRAGALLGDIAARLTGVAGLLTSDKMALGEPRFWICSNERAKRDFGLDPSISLEQGLCDTYRWYLEKKWL